MLQSMILVGEVYGVCLGGEGNKMGKMQKKGAINLYSR